MDTGVVRARTLTALGASPAERDELLAYTGNHFHPEQLAAIVLPLAPEAHVAVWREYAAAVAIAGSIAPLRDALVQLRFPIREGISAEDDYRAATRRGAAPPSGATGVPIHGDVRLIVHDHPAGPVPAIITAERADFVALVQALTERNEPRPVPDSQGAAVVAGFNNWDRIRRHRRAWEAGRPDATTADWEAEFARIVPEKAQYQDRFLLVSGGPYSGVPAAHMGMADREWRARSVALRLEHEAAHYFTRRVFGSMKNRVHDELMADWAGIRAAAGRYRADWFLRFMGLEAYPRYRNGGRLENYRASPVPSDPVPHDARGTDARLSDGAFRVLQAVTCRAARTLEAFEQACGGTPQDPRSTALGLVRLASLTLDEMASDDGLARLALAQRRAEAMVQWNGA